MAYKLTEEGKRYLKHGLPELKLVEFLERKGPQPISKAQSGVESFNIALQWAKKKGWVEIKNDALRLLKRVDKAEEIDGLQEIESGGTPSDKILAVLLQRRLVEEEREDIKSRGEKMVGKEISHLAPEIIAGGAWKKVSFKPYNVSVVGERIHPGKRQPYANFLRGVKRKMIELGFKEMTGPLVETEFWNFDALFQPQNHPARDWTDTYQLKQPKVGDLPDKKIVDAIRKAHEKGWGYKWEAGKASKLMPRAHDTAISPRYLAGGVDIPGKYFSLVRCFRPDVLDATHLIEFDQMGGFVVDNNLNFRHLLGLLKMFAREFAGTDKVRFVPSYFPFTEPSVELMVKHPKLGWMELGGAGIFREEFVHALGIKAPVIAWGIGIARLAMFKLGIDDIRYLFSTDLEWLRNQVVV